MSAGIHGKDNLSRAVSVLGVLGQHIPQASVERARDSGRGLSALFPNSSYEEVAVTHLNAPMLAAYLTDVLSRGAAVALEFNGTVANLEHASMWALYLGANNALQLRVGGPSTASGESRWARTRSLDAQTLETLAVRDARFMILQPDYPTMPLHPMPLLEKHRTGGPIYGTPRTIRPLMLSFEYTSEDTLLDAMRTQEINLHSIITWFNGVDSLSEAFHVEAANVIRERAPRMIGVAVRQGLMISAEDRYAVARELVEADPGFVAINIRDFVISSPQDRIALAKRVVALTGSQFLDTVWRRFDIVDADAGAEIDAIAAAHDRARTGVDAQRG